MKRPHILCVSLHLACWVERLNVLIKGVSTHICGAVYAFMISSGCRIGFLQNCIVKYSDIYLNQKDQFFWATYPFCSEGKYKIHFLLPVDGAFGFCKREIWINQSGAYFYVTARKKYSSAACWIHQINQHQNTKKETE